MPAKFRNKYRIESARLENWNYGSKAFYFVTICTKDRVYYFGNVVDGEMVLNKIGQIVKSEWLKTFELRPDMNLIMCEFVVMPNHFHAIIGIGENAHNTQRETQRNTSCRDAMHCVSTNQNNNQNKFGPQTKNLASIIRGFKIGVTKNARTIKSDFTWQPRYHDHIIRNDESFHRITEYIINNPLNWSADQFHI